MVSAHMDRGRLGQGMTIMVGLTLAASAANYLSNVVFARILSPASFGDLTSLFALLVIIAVPTAAAQTVVAARLASHVSKGDMGAAHYLIRHALAHVALYAVIVGVIYSALIPVLVPLLDLRAVGPAIALAPLLVMTFFLPVIYGVMQGLDRFVALGSMVLCVAIARLAFGVPWTLAGGGAGGPIGGQAVGSLLVIVATLFFARGLLTRRGSGAARAGLRRRLDIASFAAGGAFVAFALLSNLDVLLAKVFLSPGEAGDYAALATVGKIVLFLPAAVSIVMVPNASRTMDATGSSARVLRISALAVLGGAVLVAVPAALEPQLLLSLMFGGSYVSAAAGVLPIVVAGGLLAVLYLLVVYTVAIQDHRWVYLLLGGVAAQVLAIGLFHDSAVQIADVQACVIFLILIVNEVIFHPILRTESLLARGMMRPGGPRA